MADFIAGFIAEGGYGGVFTLMVLENVFPPIPSELVLPFIGLSIASGVLSPLPALVAATAGSVVGTTFWYLIGRFVSIERLNYFFGRYGAYVAISPEDFERATSFFRRYQVPAVFGGRLIPTVRSVISIPAGTLRMSFGLFLVLSTLGSALWNALLIYGGFLLHQDFVIVERYIDPVANGVVAVIIVLYLIQVIRFHTRKRSP